MNPLDPTTPDPDAGTRLLLIRHAEVEAGYQGVFGGRIDMDLSPRGHEQAAVVANCLRGKPFGAVYASPMKRVQQTLAPFVASGAPKPIILPDLREVDFGDWTGLAWAEVEEKYGVSPFSWLEQLECGAIANADSTETLMDRVEPCVQQILSAHAGQQVAVFCHGGIIRAILALLLGWPLPRMGAFEIEYASLTQVLAATPKAELQLLNFTPWRDIAS